MGKCEVKAEVCFEIYDPVCGCDGATTYDNACKAAAAGASVRSEGECPAGAENTESLVDGSLYDLAAASEEFTTLGELQRTAPPQLPFLSARDEKKQESGNKHNARHYRMAQRCVSLFAGTQHEKQHRTSFWIPSNKPCQSICHRSTGVQHWHSLQRASTTSGC